MIRIIKDLNAEVVKPGDQEKIEENPHKAMRLLDRGKIRTIPFKPFGILLKGFFL